ncbi:hypothetical protein SK128_010807 [Halocaridina rubra]|uniref:Spindle and centriole-associated protein 1 n=1 Tax=Halocaridina rubra TaxID=373956 RepID=A0AAN8XM61_HALRR
MDQDRPWSRGRTGWGSEGLGHREGAEGLSHSPRRMYHSGAQSHPKYLTNRPIWDDTVHDLASMRLTPAELARKLASRQSSNLVLARAQLLEQSRKPGSHSPNLPPSLAARLQAARQQSIDSILAQSNATLMASQKIRQSEQSEQQERDTTHPHPAPDGQEETEVSEIVKKADTSGKTTPQLRDVLESTQDNLEKLKTLKSSPSRKPQKHATLPRPSSAVPREAVDKTMVPDEPRPQSAPQKPARRLSADGAATKTSLDHTITMVVNTCRELWQQLQEERVTRERLQQQLHQQGSVITTLTAELLQIQDQQEAILREVTDARASGLWGGEPDISGMSSYNIDRGEDFATSQVYGMRSSGSRPGTQSLAGRHPQRSILRANRTIHQPHLRQPPPYQPHQQSRAYTSLPYQPPHSPRPHQPSPGSRDSSPPLVGLSAVRGEGNGNGNYRNSISKQIREALASGVSPGTSYASEGSKITSHLNVESMQQEPLDDLKTLEKERIGDNSSLSSANKENDVSRISENVMESTITEMLEKKN